MENVQLAIIGLSAVLYFIIFRKSENHLDRLLLGGLAWLCFNFFMREIELDELDLDAAIIWLRHGWLFYTCMAIGWLIYAGMLIGHTRPMLNKFKIWVKSPVGIAMILAGISLGSSWPFDKGLFDLPHRVLHFWEEYFEINGYLLIFVSAILSLPKKAISFK